MVFLRLNVHCVVGDNMKVKSGNCVERIILISAYFHQKPDFNAFSMTGDHFSNVTKMYQDIFLSGQTCLAVISNTAALPLVDRNVGANQETVDFDIKNLAKWVKNCFISGNFQISDTFLSTKDVRCTLSLILTLIELIN